MRMCILHFLRGVLSSQITVTSQSILPTGIVTRAVGGSILGGTLLLILMIIVIVVHKKARIKKVLIVA